MTSSQSSDATESLPRTLVSEVDAIVEDAVHINEWPKGDMLPLNAMQLTLSRLCQIGEVLGMPSSSSASCSELKLMVEGKLMVEMGYDLSNVQVILSDEVNGIMYLVNYESVIKHIEMHENVDMHVTGDSRDNVCRALCYDR